jgi:hypothetical protein
MRHESRNSCILAPCEQHGACREETPGAKEKGPDKGPFKLGTTLLEIKQRACVVKMRLRSW